MNEVHVGVPFPAIPLAITRHALAPQQLREVLVTGSLDDPTEAKAQGRVGEIAPSAELLARAWARSIAQDSVAAYVAVKTQLLSPTLAAYRATPEQVNGEFLDVWFSENGQRRLRETRDRLLRCS